MPATHHALIALVERAREAAATPVAWLSRLEEARERLVAGCGLDPGGLPESHSFAFGSGVSLPLFLEDAAQSSLRSHPWVASGRVRFVAAVPITSATGELMGSLTVVDSRPRRLLPLQAQALANLASLAAARLEAGIPARSPARPEAEAAADLAQALERERELGAALVACLPGLFFLASPEGRLVRWNARLAKITGWSESGLAALDPLELVCARDRKPLAEAMRHALDRREPVAVEVDVVDREGNPHPHALTASALRLGGREYVIALARDMAEARRSDAQADRDRERLDLALAASQVALWDWDLRADKVYFDANWAALVGGAARETTLRGEEVADRVHPDDQPLFRAALGNAVKGVADAFDCEYRVAHASRQWVWMHSRGRVTERGASGTALRMTGTSTDVTKRKSVEERAEYLATRDALTGLPNRVLLHDRLAQAIVNAARNRTGFAFMFIDLDRFKTINDSLGHHVGDELLKRVAARLTACVRASDTVARLGGDEFAVILENLREDDEGAQQVAEKMILAMASPMLVENHQLATSCSIGISLYPADGRDGETLMKHADAAMYHAKESGRNNYRFFSAEMNTRAQERLSIENYLRLAIRRNELVLHYQPRVSLATGALTGVEALIRWQHPRRGLLAPDKFIGVAEDSGLIVPMGEWVLESACAQMAAWQSCFQPPVRLSVNLSVRQVADGERLFAAVARSIERSGIDPAALELELTESLLMQNIEEQAALLTRLGELGVRLAIDDFGTGYSSLAYLKALPVHSIKIDSSFVRDIHSDPNDEAIIRAVLAMAHSLRLSVVAEGVETAAQYEALRDLGCDEYQGFHASAPLAPADFERLYCGPAVTSRPES